MTNRLLPSCGELRRVAALVGQPYLTEAAFNKHSKAHSTSIRKRFGKWHECLARAGLEYRYSGRSLPKRISGRPYTDEEMIAELQNVSAKIGTELLTVAFFNRHAEMGAECVRRRFGSWGAALKAAGIAITLTTSFRGQRVEKPKQQIFEPFASPVISARVQSWKGSPQKNDRRLPLLHSSIAKTGQKTAHHRQSGNIASDSYLVNRE